MWWSGVPTSGICIFYFILHPFSGAAQMGPFILCNTFSLFIQVLKLLLSLTLLHDIDPFIPKMSHNKKIDPTPPFQSKSCAKLGNWNSLKTIHLMCVLAVCGCLSCSWGFAYKVCWSPYSFYWSMAFVGLWHVHNSISRRNRRKTFPNIFLYIFWSKT